jgi:hypothetical protein
MVQWSNYVAHAKKRTLKNFSWGTAIHDLRQCNFYATLVLRIQCWLCIHEANLHSSDQSIELSSKLILYRNLKRREYERVILNFIIDINSD